MREAFEQPAINLLDSLRSYEGLPDITCPGWDCEPLIMWRYDSQGHSLCFVAVNHRSDAGDHNKHFQAVNASWQEFSTFATANDCSVVVEGGLRYPASTPEGSYKAGGEACLAAYWAAQHGAELHCFEPPREGADYLLTQGFSLPEIATFLFARLVPSWQHRILAGSTLSFEDFAATRLTGGGNITPFLATLGFTYQQLVGFYEEVYNTRFTPDDPATVQFLKEETTGYMLKRRSRIHEIAIAANRLRDRELAKGILLLWQQNKNIFIAYGYSHGLTLQPFIETLGAQSML